MMMIHPLQRRRRTVRNKLISYLYYTLRRVECQQLPHLNVTVKDLNLVLWVKGVDEACTVVVVPVLLGFGRCVGDAKPSHGTRFIPTLLIDYRIGAPEALAADILFFGSVIFKIEFRL